MNALKLEVATYQEYVALTRAIVKLPVETESYVTGGTWTDARGETVSCYAHRLPILALRRIGAQVICDGKRAILTPASPEARYVIVITPETK